jgi:hypothetical protein
VSLSWWRKVPSLTDREGLVPCSVEPPLLHILSQMNPNFTFLSCFKYPFQLFPSALKFSKCSNFFLFSIYHVVFISNLRSGCYVSRPSYHYPFHHTNSLLRKMQILKLTTKKFCSACFFSVTTSSSGPGPPHC